MIDLFSVIRENMLGVYFIYGLAFFVFGITAISCSDKTSVNRAERLFWLLGLFGILHGCNEWLDMFLYYGKVHWLLGSIRSLQLFRNIVAYVSYIFLLQFGLRAIFSEKALPYVLGVFITVLSVLLVIISLTLPLLSTQKEAALLADLLNRYFIGLPGAMLTGLVFLKLAFKYQSQNVKKIRIGIIGCGITFILYSIFGGIIVPKMDFFPASVLNYHSFTAVTALPVQFFRTLCALATALFLLVYNVAKRTKILNDLKDSRKEYSSLMESLGELVYTADPKTLQSTYVNKAIEKLYGYTVKEWVKDPSLWEKTIHPDDREKVFATMGEARKEMKNGTVKYRAITRDETIKWMENHFAWHKNEDGTVISCNGVVYDITKRINIEDKLKASQLKYKTLYESSADAIMTLASPSRWAFTSGNPATIKMFAAKNEAEFISKRPYDLSPEYQPDGKTSAQKAVEMISKAMDKGSHFFEWTHKRINGEEFPATVLLTKINLEEKVFLQATVRDETIRVKNEELIRILSQAVDQSPSTVVITDIDYNIVYVNPWFSEITGYTREEVIGENPRVLHSDKTPPETYVTLWNTILNGERWHGEFCNKKKNGEYYWEAASITSIKNKEGKLIRFMKVAEDITENKEMQRKLEIAKEAAEAANRAKSQFLANMSHELRTPLNAIIGFSEVLLSENYGKLNEKQADYTNDIHEGGKHLFSLINDILDLSKVEANKLELKLAKVDFCSIIKNSTIIIKEKAFKHGITLSTEINDDVKEILADGKVLKQILYNLLSNAAKFTPDGGKINLKAKKHGNEYLIAVEDTGIGIDEKNKDKIFGVFEQIDSEINRKQQGTGLGLALAKKLVEMHGGKIWFESEGKDKGSTFYFSIPDIPA